MGRGEGGMLTRLLVGDCWRPLIGSRKHTQQQQERSPAVAEQTNGSTFCCGDLPAAVLAHVLAHLDFKERCRAASVCRQFARLVASPAAHQPPPLSLLPPLAATRLMPVDVDLTSSSCDAALHRQMLASCRALQHVPSTALTLDPTGAERLVRLAPSLTRLVLVDPAVSAQLQQLEGEAWLPRRARPAERACLRACRRLAVLSIAMSRPLLDVGSLPPSLQALHLDLASGYSAADLSRLCSELAQAAPQLPQLRCISLAAELDPLLSADQGAVLDPLSDLTSLTSLSLVEYSHLHPDSAAHEGYRLVPTVLQLLPRLAAADLHLSSGQHAALEPAAGVRDLSIALTLAHYESEPFDRLPPSVTSLTGLTSLSILSAEFEYSPESDMYVFDAAPLAACPGLQRLLLELHGVKSALHDVQGLASLAGLTDVAVFLKSPDVQSARPEVEAGSQPASLTGSNGGSSSGQAAAAAGAGHHHGLQRLLSLLDSGGGSAPHDAAPELAPAAPEWALALVDHALDQLRPEFALSLPAVSGRLLVATTCRLCLRQPERLLLPAQPMLLAAHLQVDLAACGDAWSGEAFLRRMSACSLRSWAARAWAPSGVELLGPARYPQLAQHPGATKRIDDQLLAVARRGTSGSQVVATVMALAEERCASYFC